MYAAFRNFIFTLIIMLAVLGYTAYRMLPDLEDVLFNTEESSDTSSAPVINSEDPSADVSEGDVSNPGPDIKEEFTDFTCVFATRNTAGDICSLIYAEVVEEKGIFLTCRIPVDVNLYEGSLLTQAYRLLGKNDSSYLINKISPLVGKKVDYFIICDAKSYAAAAGIAERAATPLTADLTYDVRYIDPDFLSLIVDGQPIPDEYYRTLTAGRVSLSEVNAGAVLNSSADPTVISYSFQESLGLSLLTQLFSVTAISESIESLTVLYNSVSTNIPLADLSKYASLLFGYSGYRHVHITYPTDTTTSFGSSVRLPSWETGIAQIRSAVSGS